MGRSGYGKLGTSNGGLIAATGLLLAVFLAALPRPAAAAAPAERSDAALVVNGAEVSREELGAEIARLQRARFPDSPALTEAQRSQIRRDATDALISRELLYQESVRRGFKVLPWEVDATIARKKIRFRGDGLEDGASGPALLPEAMVRRRVEKAIVIRKFTDKVFLTHVMTKPETDTNEHEAHAWYDAHREVFRSPRKLRVREIFVAVEPGGNSERKAKARERIEGLLERIRNGEDFAVVAKEASDGPARDKGGDLGEFAQGRMPKPMEEAVSRLSVGQTSGVVADASGYRLYQVTEETHEYYRPYPDVRDRIWDVIRTEKVQKMVDQFVAKLREKAAVRILDKPRNAQR